MAGNGPGGGDGSASGRGEAGAVASISAAAAAMGSVESRFPLPEQQRQRRRRRRWGGGCLGGLSCFGSQGRAKRVVPSSSSRAPDGLTNGLRNRGNFTAPAVSPAAMQHGGAAMTTPSLLAPPSSPASFTHSAVPSTAQSPSCFLSPISPVGGGGGTGVLSPAATMFATGPYAHETQLVSPPVFSTFTTEPSTAPLTPPPELAHLTTPSAPVVPYARFLSSNPGGGAAAMTGFAGDLQATYPLYPPGSPSSSSLISPASATPRTGLSSPFPEREGGSGGPAHKNFMMSPEYGGGLFCAAASAQFYLDQALQHPPATSSPHPAGYSAARRSIKACCKQEEEIEAYRASFGFSADELIITQSYVEISDVAAPEDEDEPFSMAPPPAKDAATTVAIAGSGRSSQAPADPQPCYPMRMMMTGRQPGRYQSEGPPSGGVAGARAGTATDDETQVSVARGRRLSRSFRMPTSASDAEVDYRRSSSARGSLGGGGGGGGAPSRRR